MNNNLHTIRFSPFFIFCLLLISHLLRSQTPTVSIATWKDNKKAAYTLIHDDYASYVPGIFRDAYPIAKARGVKICFGAITNFCEPIDWANAKTMIADGHECVNHSHNHKCGGTAGQCTGLTTYGTADFATELDTSTTMIETKAGVRPRFFIHPYDAASDSVIDYLKILGYLGTRAGTQAVVNDANFSNFMRLNYFVYDGTASSLAGLNPAIDTAIASGGYVIREFHGIDDGSYGFMTKADYTSHLDYVKSKMDDGSIWSATTTEAITYKMQRDAFQPAVTYEAATTTTPSIITVAFTSLQILDTAVLKTPVTVNVNITGITGNFDAFQGTTPVSATRNGNIISFNVYPHQGTVTLKCNNCSTVTPQLGCLKASYFPNLTLTGTPIVVRAESKIDYSWGTNAPLPNIPADNFSVRWEGTINPPLTGTYTFRVTNDDGMRLWVNNQLLINKWFEQSATTYTATIALKQGQAVSIKVEYYERGGNAAAKVAWTIPTQTSRIIDFEACPITTPPLAQFDATKCYRLTARHSNKVMELTNASTINNVLVQQDAWVGTREQIWRIKDFDGTHYQISNGLSGKVLTVTNASTASGSSITQYTDQNANHQKWKLDKNTEGFYFLTAKHSNKVLDVGSASTANGANLIQWTKTGGANQQWAIAAVGCPTGTLSLESQQDIVFDGKLDNNQAHLQWVVQSNDLKDYYELEKADNTHDFQSLTVINGSSTDILRSFSYTDDKLVDGDNYYRLKSTATDGSVQMSNIVKIHYAQSLNFTLSPNPASDRVEVDLSDVQGKKVEISLVTMLGKTLSTETIETVSSPKIGIDLNNIENGQYFIRIQAPGKKLVMKKLVVVR